VVGSVGGFFDFTSASLWQNGQLTDLGLGWDNYATGINNVGQVVGMSVDPFLWQNGVMTDIASQIPSGGNTVFVQAINDVGQIAGSSNGHAVVLNPVASLPTLAVNDLSVIEGNSGSVAANFTVNLSAASSAAVTVQFTTVDGTATAGSDYQATSGTLTFGPGETSKSVTVSVIGDRLAEANETFSVILGQPTNATIANDTGVGTIVDDEPRISISDVTKAEGKNRTTTLFTFTVTLSGAYDQAVTMSFQTLNGTATTSDKDYVAKTGTLTFNPGETTKTITIVVNGDNKREANETFYLDLYGLSSNGLFTKSRGVGMILNDD
jgi:probable HAF family extracellular repeat protein